MCIYNIHMKTIKIQTKESMIFRCGSPLLGLSVAPRGVGVVHSLTLILDLLIRGPTKASKYSRQIPQSWWISHWENKPNHRLNKPRSLSNTHIGSTGTTDKLPHCFTAGHRLPTSAVSKTSAKSWLFVQRGIFHGIYS